MITKIKIRNFQRWDKLTLDLDLVTTLIGPNDYGKSAIIRALYWLCFGRPLGDEYITHDADFTFVGIHLDGDSRLRRKRIKPSSRTTYYIGDKLFQAVGTGVPEEVRKLLGVQPINFQRQLDPPFWVLESGSQIAKNLNEIANLEALDAALTTSASRIRSVNSKIEVVGEREQQLSQKITDLSWVIEFDLDLADLEVMETDLSKRSDGLLGLRQEIVRLESLDSKIDQLNELISLGEKAIQLAQETTAVQEDCDELTNLIMQVEQHTENSQIIIPDLTGLIEESNELVAQDLLLRSAHNNIASLTATIKELEKLESEVESLTTDLELVESEIREKTKGSCPVCGAKLSSQSASPTSTYPSPHQSLGRKKRTGSRQ